MELDVRRSQAFCLIGTPHDMTLYMLGACCPLEGEKKNPNKTEE